MKRRRHDLIKQIIREEIIETQEALAAALCARHVHVTQATISRDIKELLLINVQSCDFSENIVVVRTAPGAAGTVASALDASAWSEVIGTIAGDDHIFVLIRPKEAAADIVARIQKLMH